MIVRLAPEQALEERHTRVFDLSGRRPMKGWILVQGKGLASATSLAKWIEFGLKYAASLWSK